MLPLKAMKPNCLGMFKEHETGNCYVMHSNLHIVVCMNTRARPTYKDGSAIQMTNYGKTCRYSS